jgi:hypothetical protein
MTRQKDSFEYIKMKVLNKQPMGRPHDKESVGRYAKEIMERKDTDKREVLLDGERRMESM